jgi:hypothetical protein
VFGVPHAQHSRVVALMVVGASQRWRGVWRMVQPGAWASVMWLS